MQESEIIKGPLNPKEQIDVMIALLRAVGDMPFLNYIRIKVQDADPKLSCALETFRLAAEDISKHMNETYGEQHG